MLKGYLDHAVVDPSGAREQFYLAPMLSSPFEARCISSGDKHVFNNLT